MVWLLPGVSSIILPWGSFWMVPRDSLSCTQMLLEGPKTISKAYLVSGHPVSSNFPSFFLMQKKLWMNLKKNPGTTKAELWILWPQQWCVMHWTVSPSTDFFLLTEYPTLMPKPSLVPTSRFTVFFNHLNPALWDSVWYMSYILCTTVILLFSY